MDERQRTERSCGCVYYDGHLYSACDDLTRCQGKVGAAREMLARSGKSVLRRCSATALLENARAQLDEHLALT